MGKDVKGKELGMGISQRRDGYYIARFYTNGKKIQKVSKDLKAVRKWRNQLACESGLVERTEHTVDSWFDYWINTYKEDVVSDNTTKNYRNRYNANISKSIGRLKLTEVKQIDCQKIINQMFASGKYAYMTIQQAKITMHALFKSAVENRFILSNPADGIVLKRKCKPNVERRVLTKQEQETFLKYAYNTMYYNAYVLALETGMRVGEVGGLQWSDIDFDKGCVYVNRTLLQEADKGGFYFGEPKSEHSKRMIPLSARAKEVLLNQKQKQEVMKMGNDKWHCEWNGLVFTTVNGNPVGASTFRSMMLRICNRINKDRKFNNEEEFEPISFHGLRHTFGTRAIEAGVQPKTLQKIMGHSSITITMDLYVHVTDEHLFEEMYKFGVQSVQNLP